MHWQPLYYWRVRMFEYPEIKTLVKQMRNEIIGKTIKSGIVVKKNNNMFMGDDAEKRYASLTGGAVSDIECLPLNIFIRLDNGWGILIRQSGGKILYNKTPSDVPENHNIIFNFTDDSSLTYTMSLFSLAQLS